MRGGLKKTNKLRDGQQGSEASTMNSLNETRKSLTPSPSSESVAIKFDSLSSTFEINVELCRT